MGLCCKLSSQGLTWCYTGKVLEQLLEDYNLGKCADEEASRNRFMDYIGRSSMGCALIER